jgi:thiol-disulfide isomerase/thioredoxin
MLSQQKLNQRKIGTLIAGTLAGCAFVALTTLAGPAAAQSGKGGTLAPGDAAGLGRAIKAARGKVVMVNFWATWCGPCVAEFPELVAAYNTHKTQGMLFYSVSGDELSDQAKAAAFLKKQNAPSTAFIKPKGDVAAWTKTLDGRWDGGSLPRTYLIDRNGKIRKTIDGKINPADLNKTLSTLLAEKPGAGGTAASHGKGPLGG